MATSWNGKQDCCSAKNGGQEIRRNGNGNLVGYRIIISSELQSTVHSRLIKTCVMYNTNDIVSFMWYKPRISILTRRLLLIFQA